MMFNLRPNHRKPKLFLLIPLLLLMAASTGVGQTNTFTYQGRLTDGGTPATGTYDFQFKLYDAPTGGSQQPPAPGGPTTITNATVTVTNGVFTVQLDFGSGAFPGGPSPTGDRYLEIAMRHPNDAAYTTLSPRQQITSTPYAIRSSSAQAADNATQLATQLSSAGTINTASNPVDWTELKHVPSFANGGYIAGNGISITGTTLSNTGVLTVDASGPLSSSGGPNPSLSLSGVVPVANGGTGTTTQNFVDLSTNQSIAGNKTFTSAVTSGSLAVDTNTLFVDSANHRVGIGTANPSARLSVAGNVALNNNMLQLRGGIDPNHGVLYSSAVDGPEFRAFGGFRWTNGFVGATERMRLDASGNLGIGISTPSGKLDVAGVINTSTQYNIGGSPVLSVPGLGNVFAGVNAGVNNSTGGGNAFFGFNAGLGDPSNPSVGSQNSFFGSQAGQSNSTGDNNSFFGNSAGQKNTASHDNAFFGFDAGLKNSGDPNNPSVGSQNSFFGSQAGQNNTAGQDNAFFGFDAGLGDPNNPNVGNFNSFFGSQAGQSNTRGGGNAFFGWAAGFANKGDAIDINRGNLNSFFGNAAGVNNTTGSSNSFLGAYAGVTSTTGDGNTFVGSGAGYSNNHTGSSNVAVGVSAGGSMADGDNNNIYIANTGANESKTIRIGDIQTQTFIAGINTPVAGQQVVVNANGQLGTVASSRRFKENIRDMGANSSDLLRLRPVTFLYKPEYSQGARTLQYGLIAEEVAKVNPNLVAYAKDGTPYTVQYHLLTPMLLNEVQKQHKLIQSEEQQIEGQAQRITELTARLTRLETLAVHHKIFRAPQGHGRRRTVRSAF